MASFEPSLPTTEPHFQTAETHCPLCDQPIPNERAEQVIAVFRSLRERAQNATAEIEKTKREASAEIEKIKREACDEALKGVQEQLKDAETQGMAREKKDAEQRITTLMAEKEARELSHKAAELRLLTKVEELKQQTEQLKRALEQKTAGVIGEGAEINLFDKLKERFPGDRIERVEKGTAGADIVHRVIDADRTECGTILYESKNSMAWKDEYVTKLRQDQIVQKAEHAILSTFKLPAEAKEADIHIQDGVIVSLPVRVPILADILRRHIIQDRQLRSYGAKSSEKKEVLYSYITSPSFHQHLESIDILTKELLELDTDEEKAHNKVWKKRATLIKATQKAEGGLHDEIDEIIEGE